MKISLKHLKKKCAACERSGVEMNKEHIFPEWLILKTNTHNTGISWLKKKKVPALKVTIPLCRDCNSTFGKELEAPVSKLFEEIEFQKGISDNEAELLIRWLWKTDGLAWVAAHPHDKYTETHTLKERVLRPINEIRENLVLAVSLIKERHPDENDWPMGIDSETIHDAVFVSGVFYKIALMVLFDAFIPLLPKNYSFYRLAPKRNASSDAKLFYPQIGFVDDVEAVGITTLASRKIAKEHDAFWIEFNKERHTTIKSSRKTGRGGSASL